MSNNMYLKKIQKTKNRLGKKKESSSLVIKVNKIINKGCGNLYKYKAECFHKISNH